MNSKNKRKKTSERDSHRRQMDASPRKKNKLEETEPPPDWDSPQKESDKILKQKVSSVPNNDNSAMEQDSTSSDDDSDNERYGASTSATNRNIPSVKSVHNRTRKELLKSGTDSESDDSDSDDDGVDDGVDSDSDDDGVDDGVDSDSDDDGVDDADVDNDGVVEGVRSEDEAGSSSSSDESEHSPDKLHSSGDDSPDKQHDDEEDEFAAVKKELANIPLEDLMKIKEKLGLKVFNKIMHGDKFDEKKKVFKRDNKNRPMEMSSKRPVSVLRHNVVPKEKVRRDPRFDDLSGEFQDKHFERNYSFLTNVKAKEKQLIEKKLKKTTDEEKKESLTKLLKRMNQQEQVEERRMKKAKLEQQWRDKEKEHIKDGKTPYFLKNADKKKLVLAEKFKELEKSGKVDQYLSKKRKKNAQKEKKKLPERHQRFT